MRIDILIGEMVKNSDSLNFMELTYLIKFLSEYIDGLKHERDCQVCEYSDKSHDKISRKIKDAQNVKDKLEHIWISRIPTR